MARMPEIDRSKCNGCGLCVEVCSCKVLMLVGSMVEINEKVECRRCTRWCTMCEMVCPTGAIQCPFDVIIEE
ncbi:MAG TPA: 4Fe-4S binding protein [Dehalococcoidia bacterium]|nr:4Fe-4S binding protein [Dehalococcoidia bacterium]